MNNEKVQSMVSELRVIQTVTGSLKAAIRKKKDDFTTYGMLTTEMEGVITAAGSLLEEEHKDHQIGVRHSCVKKKIIPWYFGPDESSLHWPKLREYLRVSKDRSPEMINEMDSTSSEIVSRLGNPNSPEFSVRGLVVGYVQSGKTGNMTAVIAKAVDAGYNMVIVLAGLTEKLRLQTDQRLLDDIRNRNRESWRPYSTIENDFQIPPEKSFEAHENIVHFIVLKKNTSERKDNPGEFTGPLGKLLKTIESTPPITRKRLKVLIIDDECDQASVNSANNDFDVTTINSCLRRMLRYLPCVSYIGYTATPFANVLINPYANDSARINGEQLDDLYPSDFITSLPRPIGYFGAKEIFGRQPADAENPTIEESGLDVVREVPKSDATMLLPKNAKERKSFSPSMPKTLEDSILYFLTACCVRHERGQSEQHMTMLIHTAAHTIMHERVASLVEDWLGLHRSNLKNPDSPIWQRALTLYVNEMSAVEGSFPDTPAVSSKLLHRFLPRVLEKLEFPIENGISSDRVDYDKSARTYIVTGGSILARGLTLEGLTVSYFLRGARQYDTLLQMGRWFGFRLNYGDLPRIWMAKPLKKNFHNLISVEEHVREDIKRYISQKSTPEELAVSIPLIPGMAITGAAKMKHAVQARLSYFGSVKQTTRFRHHDKDWVSKSWNAGNELILTGEGLNLRDTEIKDRLIYREIPLTAIRRFIRELPDSGHEDLKPDYLIPFLNEAEKSNMLTHWNIAVFEPRNPTKESSQVLGKRKVNTVNRSALSNSSIHEEVCIGALISRSDILYDLPDGIARPSSNSAWSAFQDIRKEVAGNTPLLILYAIHHDSKVRRTAQTGVREDLNAVDDLLGFSLVFPAVAENDPLAKSAVEVQIRPPTEDDIEAADDIERDLTDIEHQDESE